MKKVLVFLLICLSSTVLLAQRATHYTPVRTANNMTMSAVLVIDEQEIGEAALHYEIGIFDQNGVCRGAKTPKLKNGRYKYSPTIFGETGYTYTCKVWDTEAGEELDLTFVPNTENPIVFVVDGNYGTSAEPYEITFTSGSAPQPQTFTRDIEGWGLNYDPETNPNSNYYLISSPIGNVSPADDTKVADMLVNEYNLYAFNQTAQGAEWQNYDVENFEMEAGKGYLYANIEDVTLTFTGEPYTGEGEVVLVKEDCTFSGWNLIGNPFAEAAYLSKPYYVLNGNGNAVMTETLTGAIGPMEGCFVYAEDNGEVVTFTTSDPGKIANLALNLSSNSKLIDRAIVRFDEGSTLPKFLFHENDTKVYIPVEGEDFAVVNAQEMGEMPINFRAEKNGSYTLSMVSEEVNFNYLHLIDNMTGIETDLLVNPSYTFEARTTDYESRFRLVFATGNADDMFAFFSNGSLVINNNGNATVQVIDVNGRILSSENINGCANVNVDAAPGVYMIRLINGDNAKVQKVVVR